MKTATELEKLSYRDLQAECKTLRINAKGYAIIIFPIQSIKIIPTNFYFSQMPCSTKLELLGRLIVHYQTSPEPAAKKKTVRKTKSTATDDAPKSKPSAPAPSSRRSLDNKTIKAALRTPLPASPTSKPAKATRGGKASRTSAKAAGRTIAIATALVAAILAAVIMYCQTNSCPAEINNAANIARAKLSAASDEAGRWAGEAQYAATTFARQVHHQTQTVVNNVKTKVDALINSAKNGGDSSRPPVFNGVLAESALSGVVAAVSRSSEWDNARQSLKTIWSGAKLQENKANVVLFGCGSEDDQEILASAVEQGVPEEGSLIFPPGALGNDRAKIQSLLADFLTAQPKGVVVIMGVDSVALDALPVLINVLGEQGALIDEGRSVSASEATFFLTMTAPSHAMEEDNEVNFTSRTKGALGAALVEQLGDREDEGMLLVLPRLFMSYIFLKQNQTFVCV